MKKGYKFGKRSMRVLKTLHPDLQAVLLYAIEFYDFSLLEGHRTKAVQNMYYDQKKSKLKFPRSKHNKTPSEAVDLTPYPIDWKDLNRFRALVFFIKGIGAGMGIEIRLGIDWNDNLKADQSFVDAPHIELINI